MQRPINVDPKAMSQVGYRNHCFVWLGVQSLRTPAISLVRGDFFQANQNDQFLDGDLSLNDWVMVRYLLQKKQVDSFSRLYLKNSITSL